MISKKECVAARNSKDGKLWTKQVIDARNTGTSRMCNSTTPINLYIESIVSCLFFDRTVKQYGAQLCLNYSRSLKLPYTVENFKRYHKP